MAQAAVADVVSSATLVNDFVLGDSANGSLVTDGQGDIKANQISGNSTFTVGEYDVADDGNANTVDKYLGRGIIRFTLPAAPNGMVVGSATLKLTVTATSAAANWGNANILLYHSTTDNATASAGDASVNGFRNAVYQDVLYTSTGLTVVSGASLPANNTAVVLDVTGAVKADYTSDAEGAAVASFRLQLPDNYTGTWNNTHGPLATFGGDANATASLRPTLSVTFVPVPEPAALSLMVGGAGLLALRQGKK